MRKKLLFVITKSNFGGAQRYVYDLATSLEGTYDIAVASGGTGTLQKKLHEAHIRTISLASLERDISLSKDFRTFFELIRLFRKEKPDIVHLNSSKIGGLGALAARIARVPKIIFTAHGWAFNEERPFFQRKIIGFLHWSTIILSHMTIAVSEKIKDSMSSLPFLSKKIKVIHNGIVSMDLVTREGARAFLGLKNKNDSFLIGTISELHKNKGLDFLLEAFRKFHDTYSKSHLVIIGEGEKRKELEAYVEKNDLRDCVSFAGFVPDAARYLNAFDVFTLTSRTEAFPYVPLEAGLAKLPVVASEVGGMPEIIENGKSGLLVPVGDIVAICMALEAFYRDKNLSRICGEALYKKVTSQFSIKSECSETVSLYESE